MKPPILKPREVERVLAKHGFTLDRQRGSHRVYWHSMLQRTVVVPFHNKAIPLGTLRSIIRQSGLEPQEFLRKRN